MHSGVELESQADTRGPSERKGSFEEEMELVADKASPGNCTEITASYARISGSHKWLIFILSPRNMTVRSVHSRSQRYKPWSKPCHPWPAQTVPSDSSWDHSCRGLTWSCCLQSQDSDRALRSSKYQWHFSRTRTNNSKSLYGTKDPENQNIFEKEILPNFRPYTEQ